MKVSLTSVFGIVGALALAVSQVDGLPSAVHLHCLIVSAVCVALLGFYAADRTPRPPLPAAMVLAVVLVVLCGVCSGCRVGGFALKVASPTFGSVGITVGNGAIGNAAVSQTNSWLHPSP
jgi:hypothetical protein